MQHEGKCYRTCNVGPASAEERQAVEAARLLLYDDKGEYRGDDEAIFLCKVCSDNDTTGKLAI